jgi:hypothetical protein
LRRRSWKETAEAFRTSRDKVFDAVEHVVTFGLEDRVLGQIDAIGVDEIQYAKGHKYLTLVYQVDMRKSYGFRTFRCLELALYHSLGKLPEPESTHDFF